MGPLEGFDPLDSTPSFDDPDFEEFGTPPATPHHANPQVLGSVGSGDIYLPPAKAILDLLHGGFGSGDNNSFVTDHTA